MLLTIGQFIRSKKRRTIHQVREIDPSGNWIKIYGEYGWWYYPESFELDEASNVKEILKKYRD